MEPLGTTEPKFKYIDTNLPLYNISYLCYYLLFWTSGSSSGFACKTVNYSFYTLP
jgi:hypothetical protein